MTNENFMQNQQIFQYLKKIRASWGELVILMFPWLMDLCRLVSQIYPTFSTVVVQPTAR